MRYGIGLLLTAGVIGAGAGIWHFTAPAQPSAMATETAAPARGKNGELIVGAAQAQQFGIGLTVAAAPTEALLATLPADIAPPQNARQAVAAPLPGVVMRTMVVEGDSVRRGQALAVVASRDVLSLGGDLARASARLGAAQSSARRLSQLDREGIIAGVWAEEARALAAEARADVSKKPVFSAS